MDNWLDQLDKCWLDQIKLTKHNSIRHVFDLVLKKQRTRYLLGNLKLRRPGARLPPEVATPYFLGVSPSLKAHGTEIVHSSICKRRFKKRKSLSGQVFHHRHFRLRSSSPTVQAIIDDLPSK